MLTPEEDVPHLSIPPRGDNDWFKEGWAWDTTGVEPSYTVPDHRDRTQEGYYSIFQIDHLEIAQNLPTMTRPMPDTISFTTDSMPKAYTLIRLLYRYINPD